MLIYSANTRIIYAMPRAIRKFKKKKPLPGFRLKCEYDIRDSNIVMNENGNFT